MESITTSASPIKKIAVPIDFSPKCENAVKTAVQMALRHRAKIFLVHVVNPYFISDRAGRQIIGGESISQDIDAATRRLEGLRDLLSERHPNLKIETIVQTGLVTDALNDIVVSHNIDLAVIGTSGHQKLKQALLGSYSYTMLTSLNCSVMLVPEEFKTTSFKHILFPVRTLNHLRTKLRLAIAIANRNDGIINLSGIGSSNNFPKLKREFLLLKRSLRNRKQRFQSELVLTDDNAETISKLSIEKPCDIVMLNYEDEMKWKSLFAENFFKKIINNTESALLFIKPKNTVTIEPATYSGYDLTMPIPG
ncbi:universal stress protein [Kaistella rhinocerotis]|uniref:universal stress protein n=1 Tax=Kaistella rhinocerotis TaxID=3026437 RepID=UPI002554C17F|nr:universal stress protein [Kaistella sp. Ran72]